MELIPRHFPNVGVVEAQLPENVVENIWKVINEAREQPEDMKPELAGNISSSIRLDASSPLLEKFVSEVLPSFMDSHIQNYGSPWRAVIKEGQGFNLDSLWVNFQKKHEFNPPHDHSGVFSFVIWMQIPTSFAEQRELPICADSNADNVISNFAFSYTNTLGKVSTFAYNMEKEAEGYMVMFPSQMLHQVFPFYDNEGERISISGNISIEDK
mgnify:FL=1|tara:strand:- start:389 stop:1024 length:636 start_codon:yes stop_codon:yes gene_type:complete